MFNRQKANLLLKCGKDATRNGDSDACNVIFATMIKLSNEDDEIRIGIDTSDRTGKSDTAARLDLAVIDYAGTKLRVPVQNLNFNLVLACYKRAASYPQGFQERRPFKPSPRPAFDEHLHDAIWKDITQNFSRDFVFNAVESYLAPTDRNHDPLAHRLATLVKDKYAAPVHARTFV